jgi:uncharacterized protein (DUF2336 family)
MATDGTMNAQQFLTWMVEAPAPRRAQAARALARACLYRQMDLATRVDAEAALTVLLDDPAPRVRQALADVFTHSGDAPRHIILSLAADHMDVAEIVLANSPVFIDAELVKLASTMEARGQIAIAGRLWLSPTVSAAMAQICCVAACRVLVANMGAEIPVFSLRRMAERHGGDADLRDALLARPDTPAGVRQILIDKLSQTLGDLAVMHSWMARDRAQLVTREACDKATVAMAAELDGAQLFDLVDQLHQSRQLSVALLLRAVCNGNLDLLITALSVLADHPAHRVNYLVRGARLAGLKAVYLGTGLPQAAFAAIAAAVEVLREFAGRSEPPGNIAQNIIDWLLAKYQGRADPDLDHLLVLLRRLASEITRDAARAAVDTSVAAA